MVIVVNIKMNSAPNSKPTKNSVEEKNENADSQREQVPSQNKKGFKAKCQGVMATKPHIFIIFVVSVIGFCYQMNLSLHQYWNYETTVSFAYEMPKNNLYQYPSATLCFEDVVPHFKLIQKFPEYSASVDRIKAEMKARNEPNYWSNSDTKRFINITGAVDLDGEGIQKYFEEKILRNESILDILQKYSHSEHEECLLDSTPAIKKGHKMDTCEGIFKPVETINGEYRCFTHFLQFDLKTKFPSEKFENAFMTSVFVSSKTFERRSNKVYYMQNALNKTRLSHPFERNFRALISIHPPNMIPVPEFYPTISLYQFARFYVINFLKTISHKLEKPYQTKCFKYDLGNSEQLQSHDDCFTKCVMNKYRDTCKCLPRTGLLYRETVLTSEDRFCDEQNTCQNTNYRTECSNECQPDCLEEKYEFEKFVDIPFYSHADIAGIQISRKPVLDKVYRHSPSVSFIQLICDFGGLGGLWLGFSVITSTTSIISMITKKLVVN